MPPETTGQTPLPALNNRNRVSSGSWQGNLLLMTLSIVFMLGALEIALQHVPLSITERVRQRQELNKGEAAYEAHPKNFYAIAEGLWTLTPGFTGSFEKEDFAIHVSANRDGIRDRVYGRKEDGTFRYLGLGDSFAFGWGVENEESFYKVLERKLNHSGDEARYEVINAGMPGYGTYEAFEMLRRVGLGYEPDAVILSFYEGNDYKNNGDAPRRRVIRDGYLADRPGKMSAATRFLRERSLLFALVHARAASLMKKTRFSRNVEKTKQLLMNMKQVLDPKGIPLALVFIPDQDAAVYTRSPALKLLDRTLGGMDIFDAREEIRSFSRDHGISFYTLSKHFEDDPDAPSLRLKDTHFNAAGHAEAAQEMYTFLTKERMTP